MAKHSDENGGNNGAIVSVWLESPQTSSANRPQKSTHNKNMNISNARRRHARIASHNTQFLAAGKTSKGTRNGIGGGKRGGQKSTDGPPNKLLSKIWRRINENRYYPTAAKINGIEGVPRVRFSMNIDGSIKSISIIKSCGYKILDDAALKIIRRSEPFPFYPFPIDLAINFSISN